MGPKKTESTQPVKMTDEEFNKSVSAGAQELYDRAVDYDKVARRLKGVRCSVEGMFTQAKIDTEVAFFEATLETAAPHAISGTIVQAHILFDKRPPCELPLEELEEIECSDLIMETVHVGKFLAGRIFGQIFNVTYIKFFMKDANGDPVSVALCNLFRDRPFDHIIKPGTFVVIKHPFFALDRLTSLSTLRVEHPSDIIFFDETSPLTRTFFCMQPKHSDVDYREVGNAFYKDGKYGEALVAYTKGLNKDPANLLLLLNRAAVRLALDQFDGAKKDCQDAVSIDEKNIKGLSRLAKAHYGLREFKEALGVAEKVFALDHDAVTQKESENLLKQCSERVNETNGVFDFSKIYETWKSYKASGCSIPKCDVADYVGPLEIRDAGEKGRGVFLTEDVKKGQLLMVSPAFETGAANPRILNLIYDLSSTDGTRGMAPVLAERIMQKLYDNPSLAPLVMDLRGKLGTYSAGPNVRQADAFRVLDICTANCFASGPASSQVASLYIFPSYVNHSCVPNCVCADVGTLRIWRARQDLTKGTELTISYLGDRPEYIKRSTHFLKMWGFECDCEVCQFDKKAGSEEGEKRLLVLQQWEEEVRSVLDRSGQWPTDMKPFVQKTAQAIERLENSHKREGRTNQYPAADELYRALSLYSNRGATRRAAFDALVNGLTRCFVSEPEANEYLNLIVELIGELKRKDGGRLPPWVKSAEPLIVELVCDIRLRLCSQSFEELKEVCQIPARDQDVLKRYESLAIKAALGAEKENSRPEVA